jgi:hypothetical protein
MPIALSFSPSGPAWYSSACIMLRRKTTCSGCSTMFRTVRPMLLVITFFRASSAARHSDRMALDRMSFGQNPKRTRISYFTFCESVHNRYFTSKMQNTVIIYIRYNNVRINKPGNMVSYVLLNRLQLSLCLNSFSFLSFHVYKVSLDQFPQQNKKNLNFGPS